MSAPHAPIAILVDRNARQRRVTLDLLASHGIEVVEARWANQALVLAQIATPDVYLVALDVRKADDLLVCAELRRRSSVPILALTNRADDGSLVAAAAIAAGVTECIALPIGGVELAGKVRAHLRAEERGSTAVLESDGLLIDVDRRIVKRDGAKINLSRTEWAIIGALVRNAGRPVSYPDLAERVWGNGADHAAAGRLRVHVTYLRRKLERCPESPRVLLTESGFGYRLAGEDGGPRTTNHDKI